jgi:hypothetical protein
MGSLAVESKRDDSMAQDQPLRRQWIVFVCVVRLFFVFSDAPVLPAAFGSYPTFRKKDSHQNFWLAVESLFAVPMWGSMSLFPLADWHDTKDVNFCGGW